MQNLVVTSVLFLLPIAGRTAECPSTPPAVFDINAESVYKDSHHSVVDKGLKEQHDQAVQPLEDFIKNIAKRSDVYMKDSKKHLQEALCVNKWLFEWAQQKAMLGKMKANQAYHERKWMLAGLGLVYAKTQKVASKKESEQIEAWFKKIADETISHSDQFKGSRNNHYYWEGLAVGVVGAITADAKYQTWGQRVFENAMGQIQEDGSLPKELERGRRALHYHAFSAAPLVFLSSILDLRASKLTALVEYTFEGFLKPQGIEKKAGAKQDPVTNSNLAWLEVYLRRQPNSKIKLFLKDKHPLYSSRLGGDLTIQNPLEKPSK